MRILALAALAAYGCGATSGSAGSGHPLECRPVVSALFERSRAFATAVWGDRQKELTAMMGDLVAKSAAVAVESCRDDRWSTDLLACLDRMTVTDDPHECNHLFTQDQVVGLVRRLVAMMQASASEPPDAAR